MCNKRNCRIEIEGVRFFARRGGGAETSAGVAEYCVEDVFVPDNEAGWKVRLLNAREFSYTL